MNGKRLLIIEDEADIAEMLAMRLRKEGFETQTAGDGVAGMNRVMREDFDALILDLMLPGMPGMEILRTIRRERRLATLPVIILSAKGDESDIVVGLEIGADDYLTKPFQMSILVARINALLRRVGMLQQEPADEENMAVGPIEINMETYQAYVSGEPISLTATEFRLLAALMAAGGRVLTRNQLIDKAIGEDAIVTDRTIDVHLTALRGKIGPGRDLIQTVRGIGYRLAETTN